MVKLQEKKKAQDSEGKGLYTKSSRLVCSRGPDAANCLVTSLCHDASMESRAEIGTPVTFF